jgi:hypothetical protein
MLEKTLQKIALETLGEIQRSSQGQKGNIKYLYSNYNLDILPLVLPIMQREGVYASFSTDIHIESGREFVILTITDGKTSKISRMFLKEYSDIKDRGSHITYLKRYLLVTALNLATEPDLDGSMARKIKESSLTREELEEQIKKVLDKAKNAPQIVAYFKDTAKQSLFEKRDEGYEVAIADNEFAIMKRLFNSIKGEK